MTRATALGILGAVVVLAVVRPWTVRPLEVDAPAAFDPGTYALALWPRVLDDARTHAVDVASVPPPAPGSSAKARFLKGSGVVAAVDRTSRVGFLRIRLSGASTPDLTIQIGPVIRGTTLRDALSFVEFSDFTNQSDYAAAANALNDHVLRAVVGVTNVDALQGRTIEFVGAASRTTAAGTPIEIVPVAMTILDAGRS